MGLMNFNYKEENEEGKKFQITRGMLILGGIILFVLIIIIITIVSLVNKNKKSRYTMDDFIKLETRMVEEAPIYISQKNIEINDKDLRIDLKELLEENGGSIDSSKLKAAKICEGYVIVSKDEYYASYIKCKDLYTTSGYVSNNDTNKTTSITKNNKDDVKPVINLKGDKEITINEGSKYKEPGFTAVDNKDGDITSKVKIKGKPNAKVPGEYTILYIVRDKMGNLAEERRKIIVLKKPVTNKQPEITTTPPTTPRNTTPAPRPPQTTSRRTTTRYIGNPQINLYGSSTIYFNVGGWYSEPGYNAKDSVGNDITGSVRITNNINKNAPGTYYITYSVRDSYGKSASKTRTVIVKANEVPLKGLTLSPNVKDINVGQSFNLTVYYSPSNATNKNLSWSSSNPSVASVSGGRVTGHRKGTAIIYATGSNGIKAEARVNVR